MVPRTGEPPFSGYVFSHAPRPHLLLFLLLLRTVVLLGLLASTSYASQENTTVFGVVGGQVSLPCDVIPPPDDRVSVILWYRDNSPDAMYTYDARNTSLVYRQHTPRDPSIQQRAHFHPSPPAHLTIKNISLEDDGTYECRVDFMRAPSKTSVVEVSIAEPPTSVVITRHTGQPVAYSVSARQDDALSLTCVVTGGNPVPRVWWTMNGQLLDETWIAAGGRVTHNELMLPALGRKHHNSSLACHASNNNVTKPEVATLDLLLQLAPEKVEITGLPEQLQAGDTYTATCHVLGSRPLPVIVWTLTPPDKPHRIIQKQDLSKGNLPQGSLRLEATPEENDAVLGCRAVHKSFPNRTVANHTKLNVLFAPVVEVSIGRMLDASSIKEGIDVYFLCSIRSNPDPYKIFWFHNDQEVLERKGILVSNNHLVLQQINRTWSGSYKCKASNVVGDTISKAFNISVKFPPTCVTRAVTVHHAALGEEVILVCRVLADPKDVDFTWIFSSAGVQDRLSSSQSTEVDLESRLRYLPETQKDYGSLQCWASNSIGRQVQPCVFTVKAAGVPSPPRNCSVTNQTWESVEVTCVDPGGYGWSGESVDEDLMDTDKPRYLLTVAERLSRSVVHNESGYANSFSVTGLTPGLDYVITVFRYNTRGRSAPATLEAFTLRTAENRMREDDEGKGSVLLGVLLAVLGVFLLLVLAAVAITFRFRVRPRPSTPSETTHLPPPSDSKDYTLDHPDLLEAGSRGAGPLPPKSMYAKMSGPPEQLEPQSLVLPHGPPQSLQPPSQPLSPQPTLHSLETSPLPPPLTTTTVTATISPDLRPVVHDHEDDQDLSSRCPSAQSILSNDPPDAALGYNRYYVRSEGRTRRDESFL